jgi:hypothetical protein
MATMAITIDLPPVGELETSGDGSSPTDTQMAEEMQARQNFLDLVSPYLSSLPNRPPRRMGNVSGVDLLGRDVWSQLNHYLLLVTIDIGDPGIDQDLSAMLPQGSRVSVAGAFDSLQTWLKTEPA